MPELESIDEIEAREAAKMAFHGAEGEGGDLVVHDAWQETMSGQAESEFQVGCVTEVACHNQCVGVSADKRSVES